MKYALITGGASGMGRATSLELAKQGYYVYSCDIKKNSEEIDNIEQIVVDVQNMHSIEEAYEIVQTKTEQLDAIIHFAGIIMMNSLVEISEEEFVRIFNVNLFGVYRINKIFFPMIVKNKGKIIITTSELAPNKILPFNAIYSISKKSLDAYAEGLRMELGLLGVPVITLRPGAVETNLLNDSTNEMNQLKDNTNLYRNNTSKFKKIVDGQQGTAISPTKIAYLITKILNKNNPKFIYTKNANIKLKLLNLVPSKLQLKLFRKLLK